MLLWSAPDPAPNPRRVRLFLKAKGLEIEERMVSLMEREHKSDAVLARNPRGQVPFLELDDGRVISETISICRYLDELHPEPPLIGSTAFERAETDMWIRRVETGLGTPVGLFWQHGHPLTARLVNQVPGMGDAARAQALAMLGWFDGQLAARDWLAGDRFTLADIALTSIIDFAGWIGIEMPENAASLRAWHARLRRHLGL
ncbi:glutathione S-transferase [Sandarakinorhabdus cyanobacteriorum]|uniref:Glutathione S-transferase n=1 Tax=Sandarakinorhabdus cyanobacteriorum TaxID=1981098 RepID=A0A255YHH5_9SPHN|nr:glutathione S-transferase family protein [Sandarakinorhabdus cyanobacteriorum]OYQ28696.1 glutathione S-transferase [Sandarakinorhabdus cyanobacteriorum]